MTKLGQNFLKSKSIVDKIIQAADLKKIDTVLEVGPGKGILTKELIKHAGKVIAVEKDRELVEFLKEKFVDADNLEIIHEDILKIDPFDKLRVKNFKIVANIPYYITSYFLRKFLETKNQPAMMVLMVQKEVAERIMAKPPKMNLLAIGVQVYGEPKIIAPVSKGHFSPSPKVDSAIIKISKISHKFFNEGSSRPHRQRSVASVATSFIKEKEFFELVKKGFSQKRKMLKNNLAIPGEILKKCGLSERARAQELSLADWKNLHAS